MKRLIVALGLLLGMICICCAVLFSLQQNVSMVEDALSAAETLPPEEAATLLETTAQTWQKREHLLTKLLRRKELENITANLFSLPICLRHEDAVGYSLLTAQTRLLLQRILEGELPLPENFL